MSDRRDSSEPPMFPPTRVRASWVCRMLPSSDVVVVLPALPVMPTIRPAHWRTNRFSSLSSGTPCDRANSRYGEVSGTAGVDEHAVTVGEILLAVFA